MNNNLPLLSYIANVNSVLPRHHAMADELTDFGFPCCFSNLLDGGGDDSDLIRYASIRRLSIVNPRNKFFIYLLDESVNNFLAGVELGLAIGNELTHVAVIGNKLPDNIGLFKTDRVTHYSDWENFIHRHFKF